MVTQLAKAQRGAIKTFFYASILCSIMYEQVVRLRPFVAVPLGPLRDPRMCRWALVMPHGGGGEAGRYWDLMVEAWFESNPHVFLEFP